MQWDMGNCAILRPSLYFHILHTFQRDWIPNTFLSDGNRTQKGVLKWNDNRKKEAWSILGLSLGYSSVLSKKVVMGINKTWIQS